MDLSSDVKDTPCKKKKGEFNRDGEKKEKPPKKERQKHGINKSACIDVG